MAECTEDERKLLDMLVADPAAEYEELRAKIAVARIDPSLRARMVEAKAAYKKPSDGLQQAKDLKEQTKESLTAAILKFEKMVFSSKDLIKNARMFSRSMFQKQFTIIK